MNTSGKNSTSLSRRVSYQEDNDNFSSTRRKNRLYSTLLMISCFILGGFFTIAYISYHNKNILTSSIDTIGKVNNFTSLQYGPIDAVYTWVNGTDPRWKQEKEFYYQHWIASLIGSDVPNWKDFHASKSKKSYLSSKTTGSSSSDNRYRDNEELRYSIRSLIKYAPWIRHIYIVTDGQIPSWLNMEASHVSIIKHAEIFTNASHLPVFSSPAIEWNLDNIPNLSERFLYFNDDVFLGSYVTPEDFISPNGVQNIYLAWEIPTCAQKCEEKYLGDGQCHKACNVTACDYDLGDCGCNVHRLTNKVDCDPKKIDMIEKELLEKEKSKNKYGTRNIRSEKCSEWCHYYSIGNQRCDNWCNNAECGFDAGDCNDWDKNVEVLPSNRILRQYNNTLVLVGNDQNAAILNIDDVFGSNGHVTIAEHDNSKLIRHASVLENTMKLLLLFCKQDDDDCSKAGSAVMKVAGNDGEGQHISTDIYIVRGNHRIQDVERTSSQSSGKFTYLNKSMKQTKAYSHPYNFEVSKVVSSPHQLSFNSVDMKSSGGMNNVNIFEPNVDLIIPIHDDGINKGSSTNDGSHENNIYVVDGFLQVKLHGSVGESQNLHGDTTNWLGNSLEGIIKFKEVLQASDKESDGSSLGSSTNNVGRQIAVVNVVQDVSLDALKISFRLPTHFTGKNSPMFSSKRDVDTISKTEDDTFQTEKAEILSEVKSERWERDMVNAPQIVDVQICIQINNCESENLCMQHVDTTEDIEAPKSTLIVDSTSFNLETMHCFMLSFGHFHSKRAHIINFPIRSELDPIKDFEDGDDKIELLHDCILTTERFISLSPKMCLPHEQPLWLYEEIQAKKDEQVANLKEGQQLACEAKKERENQISLSKATIFSTLRSTIMRIAASLGLSTTIDSNEEFGSDPCDPNFIKENGNGAQKSDEKNPKPGAIKESDALQSTDTFGDSLRYVNRLFNRVFSKPINSHERRRVPAHMPFLLQKSIIAELKQHWEKEVKETSANRFRHPQDMQFSFTYFHYLMNRDALYLPSLDYIWREYIDVNKNGIADENEIVTIASLAFTKSSDDFPSDEFIKNVTECLQPPKIERVRESIGPDGMERLTSVIIPHITYDDFKSCTWVAKQVQANVRKEPSYRIVDTESEVTFHMLSEQYRFAWQQMLGTRARRTKFVCINDDMKYPNTRVSQILHELFLSIWPKQSRFELPYHLKNRYSHIDEYRKAVLRRRIAIGLLAAVCAGFIYVFWAELKNIFGFHEKAYKRRLSATQLKEEHDKIAN